MHKLFFSLLATFLMLPANGWAEEKERLSLKAGGDHNFPPYEFLDAAGKPSGFTIDLLRAVAEEVDLDVEIRTESDRPAYANRVRNKQIGDLACFDSSPASTFRVFREKFHSGFAGPWWLGYTNTSFDSIVDQARVTADISRRRDLYRNAYGILREDAPWLFLYNPVRLTAIGPGLDDWSPSTGGLLLF